MVFQFYLKSSQRTVKLLNQFQCLLWLITARYHQNWPPKVGISFSLVNFLSQENSLLKRVRKGKGYLAFILDYVNFECISKVYFMHHLPFMEKPFHFKLFPFLLIFVQKRIRKVMDHNFGLIQYDFVLVVFVLIDKGFSRKERRYVKYISIFFT